MIESTSLVLRVLSRELSPEAITRELGVAPTRVVRMGDRRGPGLVWDRNVWDFEVQGLAADSTVDRRLRRLIENLDARGANVRALAERPEVEALLWCACFGSGPELSLNLSPDALAGAARLGVALSVSVYEVSGDRDPSPA